MFNPTNIILLILFASTSFKVNGQSHSYIDILTSKLLRLPLGTRKSSNSYALTNTQCVMSSLRNSPRPLLMARNQYLRLYVLHNKNRFQSCFYAATDAVKYQTTKAYNFMVSKYYEAPALYFSLSQDEREVIEQLINLHF